MNPLPATGLGEAMGITSGPDGDVWVTLWFGGGIAQVTPAGDITDFSLPSTAFSILTIAGGPDGNVWFTTYGSVGVMTPSGQLTLYPLPGSSPLAVDICAGADGNMWFTDAGNSAVGEISPTTGQITEYPVAGGQASLGYIAPGPDGNLWFGQDASTIGAITPLGQITSYPLPTTNSNPGALTTGPDGNVWFTETDAVAKITTGAMAGQVTEFPTPSNPTGITSGSDGNLWYGTVLGGRIGRVTTSGKVTEFSMPSDQNIASFLNEEIATGPDGNIWFINVYGNEIGVADLSTTVPVVGDFAPGYGPPAGGTSVTIDGLNFTGATAVSFGGTAAPSFSVVSPTEIMATSPSGTLGPVDVTVTTPQGTSELSPPGDQFTYTPIVLYPVPTQNSAPLNIAPGPNGNVWFTAPGNYAGNHLPSNFIGETTPAGVTTEFSLPADLAPYGIAAGSDGNMWFTEPGVSKVARITPSGTITTYPTPTPASQPRMITLGPDGNVWFSEQGSNQVGMITPAGAITEFPVPGIPGAITAGPDGNLWFELDNGEANIARMTPSGTVSVFALPPGYRGASAIVSGADGNVWFESADTIGQITPQGEITEFAPPGSSFAGITSASDGNLWLTDPALQSIARFTPGGSLTEFAIPATSPYPAGITTGPDGNPWWVEQGEPWYRAPFHAKVGTIPVGSAGPPPVSVTGVTPVSVTDLSPYWGPSTGGTTVTITGVNLLGATGVSFGGAPAQSFTVVNADTVTAVTPRHALGVVDVTVTTPSGTSTPSPASQFAFSDPKCGQTITASTTLKSNIGPCGGDGIVIGADNITLNLGGHRLFGFGNHASDPDGCNTQLLANDRSNIAGIDLPMRQGVTIRNGEISGFDAGVWLQAGSGNTITSLNVHDNVGVDDYNCATLGDGIVLFHSANNTITNVTLDHNGFFDNIGLFGIGTDHNLIKNNLSENSVTGSAQSDGEGIVLNAFLDLNDPRRGQSLIGNNVINNTVINNAAAGISMNSNINATISGNIVKNNGLCTPTVCSFPNNGIGVSNDAAATPNTNDTLKNNTISGNGADGIQVNGTDYNHILNNTVTGNDVNQFGNYDLADYDPNGNGTCDHNIWSNNIWGSGGYYPACTTASGSGPKTPPKSTSIRTPPKRKANAQRTLRPKPTR